MRVLEWILQRCNNKVGAVEAPIGYLPYPADIDLKGLQLEKGALEKLLEVNKADWLEELKGVKKFFQQFKKNLPQELWQEFELLQERLKS